MGVGRVCGTSLQSHGLGLVSSVQPRPHLPWFIGHKGPNGHQIDETGETCTFGIVSCVPKSKFDFRRESQALKDDSSVLGSLG